MPRRLLGRPVRFVLSGSAVAVCQFTTMTVLVLAGVPDQLSVALAFAAALALHFTLNRRFVFASDAGYALHLTAQGLRYMTVAITSYAATSTAVAFLPDALDLPVLAVFYGVSILSAGISFLILRRWIFIPEGRDAQA